MYEGNERRSDEGTKPATRSGVSPTLIAFIVVGILAVVFVLQNSNRTEINVLFFDFNARVWFAIVIAILLGVLLDRLLIAWWRRRGRRGTA